MNSIRRRLHTAPVLMFEPARDCRGTVLVYHGLTADKETQEKELRSLAASGFLAVGVDSAGHGERRYPDFEARLRAPDFHLQLLDMVHQNVSELPQIVAALKQGYPHCGRFGLTGISMGGYVAFAAAAETRLFQAVCPILGSPDWSARSSVPLPEEWNCRSPHLYPERFPPTALLIQNAGRDEHVDPAPSRSFFETLRPYYAETPERLQHFEYARSGHFMRSDDWDLLWQRTVGWFRQFL